MEYLRLGDLERYLGAPLPEAEACMVAEQLLEGLALMHENNFVHRDLKPSVRFPTAISKLPYPARFFS